jgi:hypothetical protein
MGDRLAEVCSSFFLATCVAFGVVLVSQFRQLHPATYRLVVLRVRIALFLPITALFLLVSLAAPSTFVLLMAALGVVEGYALYW